MIELLGQIPRHYALSGKYSQEYFTRRGTPSPCLRPALGEVLEGHWSRQHILRKYLDASAVPNVCCSESEPCGFISTQTRWVCCQSELQPHSQSGPRLGLCLTDLSFVPFVPPSSCNHIDHIALIIELLGSVPRKLIMAGKYSKDFFTKKGKRVACQEAIVRS